MNFFIKPIFVEALKNFPRLVHGTSPRFFLDAGNQKRPLAPCANKGAGDSPDHVSLFLQTLNVATSTARLVKQVHGDAVFVLSGDAEPAASEGVEADAIVANEAGVPMGILTADCVPVILYDPVAHAAGVAHAGRKGTGLGVVSKTLETMRALYGCEMKNVVMGMGPGIGACCYEVDVACLDIFKKNYAKWKDLISPSPNGRYLLDLFRANEMDALRAGLKPENIFRSALCTACRSDILYSYRKEGDAGRMITVVMLA